MIFTEICIKKWQYRRLIKYISIFGAFFLIIPLCSCSVNGHKVLVEEVVGVSLGRTKTQIRNQIEIESIKYNQFVASGDHINAVKHLGKLVVNYENLFYSQSDVASTWKSPKFFTIKKTKDNSRSYEVFSNGDVEKYIIYLNRLAQYSLASRDYNGYSFYLKKIIHPEPKLSYAINKINNSLLARDLYDTWLVTISSCYVLSKNGKIAESIKFLEIFLRITKSYLGSLEIPTEKTNINGSDVNYTTMILLSDLYIKIGDITEAESILKTVTGSVKRPSLQVRSQLLLSQVKEIKLEDFYAANYLNKATRITLKTQQAQLYSIFLSEVSPNLIRQSKVLDRLVQISDKFIENVKFSQPVFFDLPLIFQRSPFISAAYIFSEAGMIKKSNWCLQQFELQQRSIYDHVEDFSSYAEILHYRKEWVEIQKVFLPEIEAIERFRRKSSNYMYSAKTQKQFSNIYSALVHSLLKVGFIEDANVDFFHLKSSMPNRRKAEIAALKIVQLAKSREFFVDGNRIEALLSENNDEVFSAICTVISEFRSGYNSRLQMINSQNLRKNRYQPVLMEKNSKKFFWDFEDISLGNKEAVFEIKVVGDEVCYFFINRTTYKTGMLEVNSDNLRAVSLRYRDLLQSRDLNIEEYRRVSNEIMFLIFNVVLPEFNDLETLYVAPDSFLTALPFGSLFKYSETRNIQKIKVIYTPSVSVLSRMKKDLFALSSDRSGSALLLGDPLPVNVEQKLKTGMPQEKRMLESFRGLSIKKKFRPTLNSKTKNNNDLSFVFRRIPYTSIEVQNIEAKFKRKGFKAHILLREQLTKENVEEALKSNPDVIHFATHAIISNEIPYIMEPSLLLSGRGRFINYFLMSREIEQFDLRNTSLTVLSACNSGIDLNYDSEGVSGLAKSFFAAGTKNIILTLWSVDDEATSEFMSYFYDELLDGHTISISFNSAIDKMLHSKKYQSPYYWAGFVLYGSS